MQGLFLVPATEERDLKTEYRHKVLLENCALRDTSGLQDCATYETQPMAVASGLCGQFVRWRSFQWVSSECTFKYLNHTEAKVSKGVTNKEEEVLVSRSVPSKNECTGKSADEANACIATWLEEEKKNGPRLIYYCDDSNICDRRAKMDWRFGLLFCFLSFLPIWMALWPQKQKQKTEKEETKEKANTLPVVMAVPVSSALESAPYHILL